MLLFLLFNNNLPPLVVALPMMHVLGKNEGAEDENPRAVVATKNNARVVDDALEKKNLMLLCIIVGN